MLLQKVESWALGWGEACGLGRPQEGLQHRSEWPRILHSAVHAHSPRRQKQQKRLGITPLLIWFIGERQTGGVFRERNVHVGQNSVVHQGSVTLKGTPQEFRLQVSAKSYEVTLDTWQPHRVFRARDVHKWFATECLCVATLFFLEITHPGPN